MNAETLHKLGLDLINENEKLKITSCFHNIINTLQNIINLPGQPQYQTNLTNLLKELTTALSVSLVNDLSPAWYQSLIDLKINDVFGLELSKRIQNIIATNNITPATAKEELDILFKKLSNSIDAFTNMVNGFRTLNIGFDKLKENECEIGVLIPRKYLDNDFENLGKELKELTFIFNTYSELITGEKQSFHIRTMSTSDPFITVGSIMMIGAVFAKTIGFIIDNYKKLLEIKKLKNELKEQGVPDKNLEGIQDYSNTYMAEKIEILISESEKDYTAIEDTHRKKEILNGFRIALNKIANRIDKGFNFEVRISSTKDSAEDAPENTNKKEIDINSKKLEFIKTNGDPILSLPEKRD